MDRRTFLQGGCGVLVAASGCLGFTRSTPPVTAREISIVNQGCGDKQNTVSSDYDASANQLHIDGTLSGTQLCGGLDITYAGSNPEDRIIVEIIITESEACDCTRYYDYEATVTFRETPGVVAVAHSAPEEVLDMQAIVLDEETTVDSA